MNASTGRALDEAGEALRGSAPEAGAAPGAEAPLTVLVADDNASDRMILSAIVRKAGYRVVNAVDGDDAVEKFREHAPDILLLDVLMPGRDGKAVAQAVRADTGQEIVPIIFVTSLTEATDLAACLEAGGDDFLSKPYNPILIQAKLSAHRRLRVMHGQLRTQAEAIERSNGHLLQEQEVAKAVFDRVIHTGALAAPNVRYLLSPLAVFNGDVLLSAFNPAGGMHLLLADFTGHGLPAAIGAIPLAETFYSMTRKGFQIEDILTEANAKLRQVLPVGVFSCVAAATMDFRKGELRVWQGGLPDCLLYRSRERRCEVVASRHLPLGILSRDRFSSECQVFELQEGDRLFLWSDGIVEAENPAGEQFGLERINAILASATSPERVFDDITEAVAMHIGSGDRQDDLTLVELTMIDEGTILQTIEPPEIAPGNDISDLGLGFEFGARSLRQGNPLPLITGQLLEIGGLRYVAGEVQTILAELFSNALEHGVLGLDSRLKEDMRGFARYYEERMERLAALEEGSVRFDIRHEATRDGGLLVVRVTDSGEGFAHDQLVPGARGEGQFCGRGVPLLHQLCRSVRHHGRGNVTEVEFEWRWPEVFRNRAEREQEA